MRAGDWMETLEYLKCVVYCLNWHTDTQSETPLKIVISGMESCQQQLHFQICPMMINMSSDQQMCLAVFNRIIWG